MSCLKEAARAEPKVCDRRFLAALLRRAAKTDDAAVEAEIARRMREQEDAFDERVRHAVERRLGDRDWIAKDVEAFEAAAGFKISEFRGFLSGAEETGRAVAAIQKSGVDRIYSGLQNTAETLRASAAKIDEALAELGLAPRPKTAPPKSRRKVR